MGLVDYEFIFSDAARFGKSVVKVRSSLAKISVYLISSRELDELHGLDELFLCFYANNKNVLTR